MGLSREDNEAGAKAGPAQIREEALARSFHSLTAAHALLPTELFFFQWTVLSPLLKPSRSPLQLPLRNLRTFSGPNFFFQSPSHREKLPLFK